MHTTSKGLVSLPFLLPGTTAPRACRPTQPLLSPCDSALFPLPPTLQVWRRTKDKDVRGVTPGEDLACVFWALMAVPVGAHTAPTNVILRPHPGLPQPPQQIFATRYHSSRLSLGCTSGVRLWIPGSDSGPRTGTGVPPPIPVRRHSHCEPSSPHTLQAPRAFLLETSFVGRMLLTPTRDVHMLIPGNYEYMMSYGKGELTLQMELRLLIS